MILNSFKWKNADCGRFYRKQIIIINNQFIDETDKDYKLIIFIKAKHFDVYI